MLRRLSDLGFTGEDIACILGNGWSVDGIINKVDYLLNSGLTTEGYCRQMFEETYPELFKAQPNTGLFSLFKPVSEFAQKEADWLIIGYIPKGQITTLASDGGIGKTSAWVSLAAAISSGNSCFLDEDTRRTPGTVLFLSTEDSVAIVLKKRLIAAGADETRIIAPDFSSDTTGELRKLKFGTKELEDVIARYRPMLCIFDPLQGFIPRGTNMGDRGAMRDCLAPLLTWGEKYGTTFLIICHTNKRQTAYGRDRIADSADLWDISRSVLMMGWTEEDGIRYLSQEKSNYGTLQDTILFSIDQDGIIHPCGTTWKRDREYQGEKPNRKTTRNDCKEWIVRTLEEHGGKVPLRDLTDQAERNGYAEGTMKRAKTELANENMTRSYSEGYGSEKRWFMALTYPVEG